MRSALASLSFIALVTPGLAQAPMAQLGPVAGFALQSDATLETGDTFVQGGVRYRLWGVQACLPMTRVKLAGGRVEDCGAVSLAGLAGLLQDGRVACVEIARSAWRNTPYAFVSCKMRLGERDVELGTALIASGLAFAALEPGGRPVHLPYAAAEAVARERKEGLWAATTFDHPAAALRAGAEQ